MLSLYTLLVVCMGVATIVEKMKGTTYVAENFYGSWWFITLWALLAIAAMAFLLQKKVQKRWPVFLLHLSFVVMLVGALITHLTAQNGTIHLRVGAVESSFVDADKKMAQLPFAMTLDSFSVETYPGTDAVMDYVSSIAVKREHKVKKMCVSMNNIGRTDGYRFYQSAYDSDGRGTQLLVAHDPFGIAVTYVGYLMLFVSLLWTMCSRHTRIRQLYREATKPLVLLVLGGVMSAGAFAAEVTPVSKEIAHEFGKVVVNYNNRLCPVNTAANEFVTKLSGKPSWNGLSADEIFMGWMIYYTEWEQQPIIRIKNAEVQQMLGIESRWACVRDFYTANNTYKLKGKANDTSLSAATRKAVREADEKIQIVTMFYNSEMLRIFPLETIDETVNPKNRDTQNRKVLEWHTPGSTELPLGTPSAEFQFINHAMDHLVKSVLVSDVDGAKQMIAKIKLYQREKADDVMPSPSKVGVEVLYNTLQSMRWVVMLCLTLSLVLCILYVSDRQGRVVRGVHLGFITAQTTWLTVLFVLRWIVSGHVPMANGFETMLFMAWATMVLTLAVMRKLPVMRAFGPLVASFCMLVSMLAVGSPQITHLMPVLQSPLLTIHVALVMIAYALLALITLLAVEGLVLASKGGKSHSLLCGGSQSAVAAPCSATALRRAAELARTTALSQFLLYPAVALLTMGIFVGAVWANVSWGTYWSWDPKETWALITMMIYAVPLHRSFGPCAAHSAESLQNETRLAFRYHLYILLAFLTVLMTYFGVNYFLTGMHSYA